MDFVRPILDVVSRLYACTAKHADYIFHLKRNLESLRNKMVELKNLSEDVNARVELAERQNMRVRGGVKKWLEKVDLVEVEVDLIMQQGDLEVEKKCLGSCCPKNFWSTYKLGRRVSYELKIFVILLGEGRSFDSVAYRAPCARVDEMPLGHTVGVDWLYEKVCSCLIEDKVGIIGLYGTGGVGKTTLMKKINNEFLKTKHQFGVVIWVSVSKQTSVRTTQDVIRNKLHIPDGMWQGRTEDERAREIFNILKEKRFVLLLDDVWQRLDLSEIGVPPLPDRQNKSKVIITTRFMRICSDMEVQATFKVNCLTREEALGLFLKKVGEDTLSSHPDIPNLAEMMAERCKGLPLALVTVGRAMANRITPQEWEQAIQELEKFPSEISGLESLSIQSCESMKEVISYEYGPSTTQHVRLFTRLTTLVLGGMPLLESIYQGTLLFPALEVISVINCPKLGRLPFGANSAAKSLKKIEGDTTWWYALQWEDETIELTFTKYFSPQYLADAIYISEDMEDWFLSVHTQRFDLMAKKKKVGQGSTSTSGT